MARRPEMEMTETPREVMAEGIRGGGVAPVFAFRGIRLANMTREELLTCIDHLIQYGFPSMSDTSANMTLAEALASLRPDEPAHWTKSGQPDLNVLKEMTGSRVTRSQASAAYPDLTRDSAVERPAGEAHQPRGR